MPHVHAAVARNIRSAAGDTNNKRIPAFFLVKCYFHAKGGMIISLCLFSDAIIPVISDIVKEKLKYIRFL